MKKRVFGFFIVTLILFTNMQTDRIQSQSIENKNLIEYNKSEKQLTLKHVIHLLRGFIFIKNHRLQSLIIKTIFEILLTGDATIDEIQNFIDSTSISVENAYLLPKIKTTDTTDGRITCRPGGLLAYYVGYIARGSYVRIDWHSDSSFGWHIEINEEKTEKTNLQIFGFYGYIKDYWEFWISEDYDYFKLDGSAVMILEGC